MPNNGGLFRTLRISALFLLLVAVAGSSWLTQMRSTDWNETLWMVVYPVNGDGSQASQAYINSLDADAFNGIEGWMRKETERYGVDISEPLKVYLAPVVDSVPPSPPRNGNVLATMWWSLQLRYWAWKNDTFAGPDPDVRMFVVYHDPAVYDRLAHSLGLQKGMLGVVNAFAGRDYRKRNNVVIAHEFLHTLGATDKYDLATNQPHYPDGFAEPQRTPLYPQNKAEIMAGRIAVTESRAVMPQSLAATVVADRTAREINWTMQ